MENCPYSDIKNSVSSIPVKDLNTSSRLTLNKLDLTNSSPSDKHWARDYRGLAEQIGFPHTFVKRIEEFPNRTAAILETWENYPHATVGKLITYLENMDRHDIIQGLIPSLKKLTDKDCLELQNFLEHPIQVPEVSSGEVNLHPNENCRPLTLEDLRNGVSSAAKNLHPNENFRPLTLQDLRNGENVVFDAFVCCAKEDIPIAADFAKQLESHKIGLKLLICERDKVAGCVELASDLELIKNRCRHMLIILTPNFVKSPEAEFQVSYAGSLSVKERRHNLVAVIYETCEIPPMLDVWTKVDLTKTYSFNWNMNKLIASLQFRDRTGSSSFASTEIKISNELHSSACFVPAANTPTETLPPTAQLCIDASVQMDSNVALNNADNIDEEAGDSGIGVSAQMHSHAALNNADNMDEEVDDSGVYSEMHHSTTCLHSAEFPRNLSPLSKFKKFLRRKH